MSGRFVAVEGPDGSGKTTQAEQLADYLRGRGGEVLLVREPGGTRLGERVREVLLDPDLAELGVRSELMLFMACRAQLVEEVIRPALARGALVVSDRFLLSTQVYQGVVGGLPAGSIQAVAAAATGGLEPDLTLLLDVPAEVGLARLGQARDRLERKGVAFHRRVRQAYLDLAEEARALVIDGTQPLPAVIAAVRKAVDDALR
jgi:dTMP kinase